MTRKLFALAVLFVSLSAAGQVRVTVSAPAIDPGLPFTLNVAVANGSGERLNGVTTTLTIPAGLRVDYVPAGCSQSAQTVACKIADFPNGDHESFSMTVFAEDSTNGSVLSIPAEVRGPTGVLFTTGTLDTQVFRTFFVTSTAPDGLGAAITEANAGCTDNYPCKIAFRLGVLPEPGWYTLRPVRALPKITGLNISIDGTTQTRLTGDTTVGPEVYIDGSANEGDDGIVFDEPCNFELAGVAIGNFRNAAVTAKGDTPCPDATIYTIQRSIHDNFFGVTPESYPEPNERGVVVNERGAFGTTITNNLISANRRSGIWIGTSHSIRVAGNTIGLDVAHRPEGNGASGIYVGPLTGQVDIRGNYIAFNHDFGIAVDRKSTGTEIGPNSIFANWQLGIDVGLDGPTPDSGVPAPTVLSAQYDAAADKTVITVASNEAPAGLDPILTIYASDAPHASGYGDGQYLIGTFHFGTPTVTFAANGDWRGKWVAATVTRTVSLSPLALRPKPEWEYLDAVSTTSEFSRAVKVE